MHFYTLGLAESTQICKVFHQSTTTNTRG